MTKSRSFKDFITAYKSGHLLDLVMPNGRALRDCTVEDCFAYGGWLEEVGWQVHHLETTKLNSIGKVGDAYNEVWLGWQFLAFRVRDLQWAPAREVDPGDEFDGGNFR
ncbi:hypothetical protein ACFIOY_21375 [Bradyrhizobium sp. TZ2]